LRNFLEGIVPIHAQGGIRLIKEGSGKLILVQSNYYSGGTVLNNGVLEVGVEDSIGTTGNIRFNGRRVS
jgi:autotransporter-associated beta strand protein